MQERKPSWPMFHTVHTRAQLLDELLAATGIRARVAMAMRGGDAFIEARATCIGCACSGECRKWLDAHSTACGDHAVLDPPTFCPNGRFIQCCRRPVTTTVHANKS